jgi:S-DNA-T family DNA segregation ATPase FtsK/SpoIIIE
VIPPPAPTAGASSTPRCWTLVSAEGAVDVEVRAADDEPLERLLPVLSEAIGVPVPGLWSGSTRLPDDLSLSSPLLAHGGVLGLGRPGPRTDSAERSSPLELHVIGGPEAGRTIPLDQGRHVLGRGAEASVPLEDPDVSRRHAQVAVGAGHLTVHDLGSTNGSRLDDEQLDLAPRSWPHGAVLRVGSSALTVRGPQGSPASVEPDGGGRLRVRPPARMVAPRPEAQVEFPRPPAPPPRRRLAWVAVALPAVAGVLMAWLMHAPQFLFFGLLSPVVALGTWGSERWWGRRDGHRSAAAHAAAVAEAESRLADAVRADRRAAQAAWPDLAALTTAARRCTARVWERRRTDPDALQIRIGSGPGRSRVVRISGEGARFPEPVEDLPVVVDLRENGGLAVRGPRARSAGVLAAAVAQLVTLHGPDEVQLALVTGADHLLDWNWARWLPHLRYTDVGPPRPAAGRAPDEDLLRWLSAQLAARQSARDEHARDGDSATPPWLVVVVDRRVDARVAALLRDGRAAGVVVLTAADSVDHLPVPVDAALELGGETGDLAVLRRAGAPEQSGVVVDRLPRSAATALARNLAVLLPAGTAATLPRSIRLLELPPAGLGLDDGQGLTGVWCRARDSLVATLGRTADGPARIDLCRQGPHALVAGTTGSGKSELLQTLIAGLALSHPPDRCSFLLVDYKGGAAFADAVHLPHTVGLLTDLDGASTQRALRALGAELTRRESLLAAHGVPDIAGLPDDVDLARLVIVVDEFATLAEEHPTFVPGLVGIAQRGRSLGVHLVLATQRPGGVVSPEIRANCTLRICLRTTDAADSRDVLGTSQAAFLPVDLPGRAYVRTGTAAPVEIQVARVSTAPAHDIGPQVRRWSWPVQRTQPGNSTPPCTGDLARLAAALRRHAAATRIGAPHRPWLPPLPTLLTHDELGGSGAAGPRSRLRIGLVDRPDAQAQEPLELDLAEGGGWLAVGGPRSGRTTLLRTVLAEATGRRTPEELHVHVLDHGGGRLATEAAALPHAGTTVGPDDALRTVRLVARLAEEVALRRAGGRPEPRPQLLLLVDGVESLSAQLDEADPAGGSATLLRLIRDGAAVGLTCVLTADRAVPGGRLAAVADHRLVLPLPNRADYAVAGIPTRAVPELRPPGRALLGEAALECQVALPRPLVAGDNRPAATAVRIAELPPDPEVPLPEPTDASAGSLVLPIGPGGDEGHLRSVDLHRTGGLLVVGPPGSGRSSALDAFTEHLRQAGVEVLAVDGATVDVAQWHSGLGGRPGAVVLDDVGSLADSPILSAVPAAASGGPVLLVAGSAADVARIYQGPVAALRRNRSAVLLTPGPGEADLLGIRLPRTPVPVRPGSGWLVSGGQAHRVQVARRRVAL